MDCVYGGRMTNDGVDRLILVQQMINYVCAMSKQCTKAMHNTIAATPHHRLEVVYGVEHDLLQTKLILFGDASNTIKHHARCDISRIDH